MGGACTPTLREEHRVRVFEKMVLNTVLYPRESDRWLEKLHNEELHDFYSPPKITWVITSRRMRWVGHVAGMEVKINA